MLNLDPYLKDVRDPAASTPQPTQQSIQSAADTYFVPATVGMIVLIIVGFAILAILMLRKRA